MEYQFQQDVRQYIRLQQIVQIQHQYQYAHRLIYLEQDIFDYISVITCDTAYCHVTTDVTYIFEIDRTTKTFELIKSGTRD